MIAPLMISVISRIETDNITGWISIYGITRPPPIVPLYTRLDSTTAFTSPHIKYWFNDKQKLICTKIAMPHRSPEISTKIYMLDPKSVVDMQCHSTKTIHPIQTSNARNILSACSSSYCASIHCIAWKK
eukprot:325569_1